MTTTSSADRLLLDAVRPAYVVVPLAGLAGVVAATIWTLQDTAAYPFQGLVEGGFVEKLLFGAGIIALAWGLIWGNQMERKLVFAWGFVGIPLALGVYETLLNALKLFQ
ncbi:MAG TPA: hypothetical protein VNV38_15845 [Stellaceae bacterium]|nr:hypothetical protein [Stellaceae bacterium]